MYEEIVVPLDGSKLAEVALPCAEELATKMDYDIVLLSVLEPWGFDEQEKFNIYGNKMVDITKYHAEKYLTNGNGQKVGVSAVTRTGNPAESIMEYVNKESPHLIVMASHGRSGISRWAVGSVADKVVRCTTRQPVMLIRATKHRPDIREKRILKKALIPLDVLTGDETVKHYVSVIASKLEMELTLLHVLSKTNHISADTEAYLENECSMLKKRGITTRYEVKVGSIAETTIDFADEFAFDFVAMSTQGRTGVSLLTLGSIAQKVFLGGNTPLLLIKQ